MADRVAGRDEPGAVREALAAQLARCSALVERVGEDEQRLLALRDLLLDHQLESRHLITEIEGRLGAFSGEDDPRELARNAEMLIESVEWLQDAWETRVNLLLDAGFDEARIAESLAQMLDSPEGAELVGEFFTGLPGDMDQTALLLDYAKRYLLSLVASP